MPTTITMPQLGETVTEGTVAQWLKNVGDHVEKYEAFVEISTDKVTAEVPAPVTGTIREIIAKEGETVPTGAPIAVIDEIGAATAAAANPSPSESIAAPHAARPAPAAVPSTNGHARSADVANAPELLRRVSPAVRRLAREHRIDLSRIDGTGTGGRITANDVLAAASAGPAAAVAAAVAHAPAAPHPQAAPAPAKPSPAAPRPGELLPLTPARRIIAQRMVESKHTAPHAWTMTEVDVTALWALREREKAAFAKQHGVSLTLLPFFIRAVVLALGEHPLMNASFTPEGIAVHRDINVGIAVALPANLVVPVIRDAASLSIAGIARAAGSLIERARTGKLVADDLLHGTFTVNNTGANGSLLSAPIINGGQAGIITMEAVVRRPVVLDGDAIAIRSMMNVCLSLDHRVVDGAVASAFLTSVKRHLGSIGSQATL